MGNATSQSSIPLSSLSSISYSIMLHQKLFTTELLVMTMGAFLIGYELGELFEEYKNLEDQWQKTVSHLCPICNENPFLYIHRHCRHILACQNCFQKMDAKCSKCNQIITASSAEKVYF